MKNLKFDTHLTEPVFVAPSDAKEITFVHKGEEHQALASKRGDSFYKILTGSCAGKEVRTTALICRLLIVLLFTSCNTSSDDMGEPAPADSLLTVIKQGVDSTEEEIIDTAYFWFQLQQEYSEKKLHAALCFGHTQNQIFIKEENKWGDSVYKYTQLLQYLNKRVNHK